MAETVQISFDGAAEDPAPFVILYNPSVLPRALFSQVQRYGLTGTTGKAPQMLQGKLKGTRKAFTEVIQSYGVRIEVVPASHTVG